MPATILAINPVLMVSDVAASVAFYERLGFVLAFKDEEEEPRYAGLRRDGMEIHVQWHDLSQVSGRQVIRFVVDEPDALHAEFVATGSQLDMKPVSDTPWGTREFHVRDPDGNGLQFYRDLN